MKNNVTLLVTISVSALIMAACSNQKETPVATQTETQTQTSSPTTQAPAAQEFIEMEGYRFKLEPDVQADGVAHLDFYVRDMADKHVKGVKGTFTITKPDGTKAELPIEESLRTTIITVCSNLISLANT